MTEKKYMSHISSPHEYFKKDKKSYRDWRFAIFRELIQNSSDAGSTKITFTIETDFLNNQVYLVCKDNGKGMDRNILENVLLSLGGTFKDEKSIGGFGYAKTILFFAHQKYEIRTRNLLVVGSGGNYDLTELDDSYPYIKGTHIKLWIDDTYDTWTYKEHVNTIVNNSDFFKLKHIVVNDEELKFKTKKFDYTLDTNIGQLKFSDNEESNLSSLWVRIDGLTMFEHSFYNDSSTSFIGVIDLNKESTEILTSNRDSLNYEYERSLNEVVRMLSEDRQKYNNSKYYEHTLNEKPFNSFLNFLNDKLENHDLTNSEFNLYVKEYEKNISIKSKNIEEPALVIYSNSKSKVQVVKQDSPFQKIFKEFEKNEIKINKNLEKVNENLYPSNFKVKKEREGDIYKSLCKKKNYILAHKWDKIIKLIFNLPSFKKIGVTYTEDNVIENFSGMIWISGIPIHTGFVFNDKQKVRACFFRNENNYQVLLNPDLFETDMLFEDLLDIAIHEACHLLNSYHNEDFCISLFNTAREFRKHYRKVKIKTLINF